MDNLAIIPARGGSKRIPKKNIKNFLGKPIIQYSIEAAQYSKLFKDIMVSTDDDEIADIAIKSGANVPFKRSKKNSGDHATLADVLSEVLNNYLDQNINFDHVCIILPTAPLITTDQVKSSYDYLIDNNFSAIIPVVKYSYPIQRALSISENGILKMINPENINVRSQDLQPTFHDSGQFYWINTENFLQEGEIFMKNSGSFELSEDQVQDIDTEIDWRLAEIKYNFRLLKNR